VADDLIGAVPTAARARFLVPALAVFVSLFSNTMMSPLYVVYQEKYHLSSVVVTRNQHTSRLRRSPRWWWR